MMVEIIKQIIIQNYSILNIKIEGKDIKGKISEGSIKGNYKIVFSDDENNKTGKDIWFIRIKDKIYQFKLKTRKIIKRNQKFLNTLMWQEYMILKKFPFNDCDISIFNVAIEKAIELGIFSYLIYNGPKSQNEFYGCSLFEKLISQIKCWAERTYEGRKVPFGFVIDKKEMINSAEGDLFTQNIGQICKFLEKDASALLTDGITSYIEIGNKLEYKVVETKGKQSIDTGEGNKTKVVFAPFRFMDFAAVCDKNKIGIVMTIHGELLVFVDYALTFTRRVNKWTLYDYNIFNETLFKHSAIEIEEHRSEEEEDKKKQEEEGYIKEIYLTCLDVAFARTGGTLAIVRDEGNLNNILRLIEEGDIFSEYMGGEDRSILDTRIKENVVVKNKSFFELNRKARQELLAIDGVTILNRYQFVTTGAILESRRRKQTSSHGGARARITRNLSGNKLCGLAIKVSADGYIECYANGKLVY